MVQQAEQKLVIIASVAWVIADPGPQKGSKCWVQICGILTDAQDSFVAFRAIDASRCRCW